ncbi:MAG: hypothetical protein O9325_05180 [Roseomonas sp.]|nr:hypothetical protein [Roseomonas sp.]
MYFSLWSEFVYLVSTAYLMGALRQYSLAEQEIGNRVPVRPIEATIAGVPAFAVLIWPIFYGHWWLGIVAWFAAGFLALAAKRMLGHAPAAFIGLPMLAFGLYHLTMPWWR